MKQSLKIFFNKELSLYKKMVNIDPKKAWEHLERAHIIGQMFWYEHLIVHLEMAKFAIKTKAISEFVYQIPRIILAIPGSIFKKAPLGNVGTSRVGIFTPMEIPEDLKKILD